MDVIGKTVRSKATGMTGTITGVSGNKISVTFDGHASITAPINVFDIDQDILQAIEEVPNKSATTTAKSYTKRSADQKPLPPGRIEYLDAKDRIEFYRVNEVLNACFGTDYKAWMKATWQLNDEYRCWFPKLTKTLKDEPVSYGCVIVISSDWNTLIFDDRKTNAADYRDPQGYRIIFAREPDNGPILFRGIYVQDQSETAYKHYVHKRVATKIRIIGNPAYDIEMLDSLNSIPEKISI